MNDYKELIEILRDDEYCGRLDFVYDAADAIEQLVKERDAAVADLKECCDCGFCIRNHDMCDTCFFGINGNGEECSWIKNETD